MKRKFLSIALIVAISLFPFQAQARRVPCSMENIESIKKQLSKLKQVEGDLKLLGATAVENGSWPYNIVTGEITTANGKRFKISFSDISITGSCFDFVIPSTDVQGKFYIKKGPSGVYTLVHWKDKYLNEPPPSEIKGR